MKENETKCKEICIENSKEIPQDLSEKEKNFICSDKVIVMYIREYAGKIKYPGANKMKRKVKGNLIIFQNFI